MEDMEDTLRILRHGAKGCSNELRGALLDYLDKVFSSRCFA